MSTDQKQAAEAKVMRGIINRHHRQALAERKEAQVAAAQAKLPNATSWSTKPSRRTKPSNLERGLTERADANREQWRKRHPDIAKEQRILRKSQVQVGERWRNKLEGTPQTHEHASRTCQGALARLCKSGGIDAEQLVAAVEIAAVAERIGADVAVRSMSIETRIDGGRQGSDHFFEALSRVRHEVAYTRWRAQARRWWSVRVSALGSLLFALLTAFPDQALAFWTNLPAQLRGRIPDNLEHAITAALFAVVLVARLIPQEEADGE